MKAALFAVGMNEARFQGLDVVVKRRASRPPMRGGE
jgi:hypothetical protein